MKKRRNLKKFKEFFVRLKKVQCKAECEKKIKTVVVAILVFFIVYKENISLRCIRGTHTERNG